MRAAVFKRVGEPLAIEEVPDPEPRPGEAVIRVQRCGICGSDIHMTSGHGDTFSSGRVPGHEYAGEVVAVGRNVSNLRVGDLVTALPRIGCGTCAHCVADDPMRCTGAAISTSHGFAEYALIGARSAVKLPAMVSLADAALTEPLCCGLRGVYLTRMQPGARVLVIGAGPIGLGAAYWARRLGAGCIVVTARTNRARDIALRMGASHFLLAGDDLPRESAEALGGEPDVVLECSGAPGMIARSIDCVKLGGAIGVVGYCMVPDTFIPSQAVLKEASINFSFVYTRRDFEHSLEVMGRGDTAASAMITHTVGLGELPAAFEALRRPTDECKVLLDPWKGSV